MNEKIAIDEALKIAEEHIKSHSLDMKIKNAEYGSENDDIKLTFYFTSESKTDLREFVKNLVSIFKIRIEFRQVS